MTVSDIANLEGFETRGQLPPEGDPNEWIRGMADDLLSDPSWTVDEVTMLNYLIQEAGTPHTQQDIWDKIVFTKGDPLSRYRRLATKLQKHELLGPELNRQRLNKKHMVWLGSLIGVEEADPGEIDPNTWLREQADAILAEPVWRPRDLPMLKFMLDEIGIANAPSEIQLSIADASNRPWEAYSQYLIKTLRAHAILGKFFNESGHGPNKKAWLGELVVVEEIPVGEAIPARARVGHETPRTRVNRKDISGIIKGLALGELIDGSVLDIIPEAWFRKNGREISKGLNLVVNDPNYPTSKPAYANLHKIAAILRRHPWGE